MPFQPGRLTAVATRNGRQVAVDEIRTAGAPRAVTLTADRPTLTADGTSVSFLTAQVVDAHGVVVPGAENLIHFNVNGPGTLAAVDDGRQENAQSYQATQVPAWSGKALAVLASTRGRPPGQHSLDGCASWRRTGAAEGPRGGTTRARSA